MPDSFHGLFRFGVTAGRSPRRDAATGRLPSAAGMVAALALFLVLRVSYFLPIETRVPSSAALMIANLYHDGAVVERSDHEAYRWYLLARGKTASSP